MVIDDFEGVASGTNGQDVALYGSYTSPAPSVYTDANGTTFTSQSISLTPGLAIDGTQYGYSTGGYGRIGADFGSDVLSSNYQSLTITFATPVNAFSLNYGSLGTAFAATATPDLYTFTINGLGSATEGADGLINQGTFEQAGTGFFGVTSATPFTSITIDASKNGAGFGADNRFYDNVQFQAVPAVSAAPEPSVWALMFAGVAAMGLMLRRSKKVSGLHSKRAATA